MKQLNIYTLLVEKPGCKTTKISFLSGCVEAAESLYRSTKSKEWLEDATITGIMAKAAGQSITEVHCLKYGTKFQTVNKGTKNPTRFCEHIVKSSVLTKLQYNPINRCYICIDGEGDRHYIDAYEWCIVKEEN